MSTVKKALTQKQELLIAACTATEKRVDLERQLSEAREEEDDGWKKFAEVHKSKDPFPCTVGPWAGMLVRTWSQTRRVWGPRRDDGTREDTGKTRTRYYGEKKGGGEAI